MPYFVSHILKSIYVLINYAAARSPKKEIWRVTKDILSIP